jgi:hypothetical protein
MRARRRASQLFVVLAVAAFARDAAAEDLRLSWRAPQGCPTEGHVREATLRSAPAGAAREPLDAEVTVARDERWTVTIRTRRAGLAAERHLDATSCEALADATAVVLAMALVPPLDAPAPATAPARAPADPDAPALAPARAPADGDASPGAPRPATDAYSHALAVGASAVTDGASLPAPALGGRAALAWTPGRARLELSGAYFSEQSQTTATSAAGATFTLLTAGARGCWAIVRGAVELSPCAAADAQVVKAHGYGASANYDASAAWLSAAGGALVRVPVAGWLALRGDVDAVVPLSRPRFVVEGDGAVHRPGALGVRAGIGAELLFL